VLKNLEIKNGIMTPKYDEYIDTYTVTIEKDVNELDIYYEVINDSALVTITGNENITCDKGIGVLISANEDKRLIKLNVIKENVNEASGLKNYFTALEVSKKEEVNEYMAPLIGGACFLLNLITFSILFHRKKKIK